MLQDFLTGRPGLATDAAAPSRAAQFQPLTTSRVAELSAPGRLPTTATAERLEAPQVEVIEEEGKVRRIVVTCICCEKIEIECEY